MDGQNSECSQHEKLAGQKTSRLSAETRRELRPWHETNNALLRWKQTEDLLHNEDDEVLETPELITDLKQVRATG